MTDPENEYPADWPHGEEGTQLWYVQNLLWRKGCKWGQADDWQCPAHEDKTASLGVGQGDKGVVIHCSAGCPPETVLKSLGVTWPLVFGWEPGEPGNYTPGVNGHGEQGPGKGRSIEELAAEHGGVKARTPYVYRDAEGNIARKVIRYDFEDGTKTVRQKIHSDVPVLYRYKLVQAGIERGLPVYVVEGEKSADKINEIARSKDGKRLAVATTAPGGAGRWERGHGDLLADADHVKIIADNDKAGFEHALAVKASLEDSGAIVSVFRSATDGKGDDVVDHLAAGHKVRDLVPLDLADYGNPPAGETEGETEEEHPDSIVGLVLPEVIVEEGAPPAGSELPWPSPNQPLEVAHKLAERITWNGVGRIRRWREQWWYWTPERGHYKRYSKEAFHGQISDILRGVRTKNANDELVPWNPNTRRVNDVLSMLAGVDAVIVDDEDSAGVRLSDGVQVSLLALRNGVLDIGEKALGAAQDSGRWALIPHSPDYFLMATQPFDYDPAATCPRWLQFLGETWPDDPESIQLLKEWFGYVLSEDMWGEKFLALYGAPGSGKTTIDNTLRALLGSGAVTDTSFFQLGQKFGKTGLDIYKLAVAGDSRWNGKDNEATVQTLLALTGRTSIEVEHKGKDKYSAVPTARLMLVANERPSLRDPAGAIMRRLMLLETRHTAPPQSRDTRLLEKLRVELPGILNWALEGLTELRSRGAFTEPESTREEIEEIARAQSDIAAFVEERCVLDPAAFVTVREFNEEYREWRTEVGITWPITDVKIANEIKARFPLLPPVKPIRHGEVIERTRMGIRMAQRNVRVGAK